MLELTLSQNNQKIIKVKITNQKALKSIQSTLDIPYEEHQPFIQSNNPVVPTTC